MVTSCSAIGCTARKNKGCKMRFFRFPLSNINRLKRWVNATKRINWNPNKYSSLCERHFQNGQPSKDPDHPDYIPNLFPHTKVPKRSATSWEIRKRRVIAREIRKQETIQKRVKPEGKGKKSPNSSYPFQKPIDEESSTDSEIYADDSSSELTEFSDSPCDLEFSYSPIDLEELVDAPTKDQLLKELHDLVKLNKETKEKAALELERKSKIIENLLCDNEKLTALVDTLKKQLESCQTKLEVCNDALNRTCTASQYLDDVKKCKYFTGLPNKETFYVILNQVVKFMPPTRKTVVRHDIKLLIVFMKLKLNVKDEDLAYRFNVDISFISKIIIKWLPAVGKVLSLTVIWPTRESLINSRPQCFKDSQYEDCVAIIDYLELKTEKPPSLPSFNCKLYQTLKILVGIAPNGTIIFLSQCWEKESSDKEIISQSGLLDNLKENDLILANKRFTNFEEFVNRGIIVAIPSFKRQQLIRAETLHTNQDVSNVSTHIEKVSKKWQNFKILNDILSLKRFPYVDSILSACAGIVNLNIMCPKANEA